MPKAFTLIELLVVVTIIVVLLALLMPAMDKAVEQALMAKCGAQLKGVGTGALVYAAQNQRAYLDRPMAQNYMAPKAIRFAPWDDRPLLSQFMHIKALLCPLAPGPADLSGSMDGEVDSTYYLFFGHQYRDMVKGGMFKGMRRLGDRWGAAEGAYNLLASDTDEIYQDGSTAYSSHPDNEGRMTGVYGEGIRVLVVFGPYTFSRWEFSAGGQSRPSISSQHVFDDNSVLRLEEVRWDEHLEGGGQERMDRVPAYTNDQDPNLYFHVPKSSGN